MDYKYWSFLSYSHIDEKTCERLHTKLETLSFPKKKIRSDGWPKSLYPIFRDKDELPTSSNLGSELTTALSQSRYLIVLCTLHSAASKWVNEEVKHFIENGRSDFIIALVPKDSSDYLSEVLTTDLSKLHSEGRLKHIIELNKGFFSLRKTIFDISAIILQLDQDAFRKYNNARRLKLNASIIMGSVAFIFLIQFMGIFLSPVTVISHSLKQDDGYAPYQHKDAELAFLQQQAGAKAKRDAYEQMSGGDVISKQLITIESMIEGIREKGWTPEGKAEVEMSLTSLRLFQMQGLTNKENAAKLDRLIDELVLLKKKMPKTDRESLYEKQKRNIENLFNGKPLED